MNSQTEISLFQRGYQAAQDTFTSNPSPAPQKIERMRWPTFVLHHLSITIGPDALSNEQQREFFTGWMAFLQEETKAAQHARQELEAQPLPAIEERPGPHLSARASRETCFGGHHPVRPGFEVVLYQPKGKAPSAL